MEGLPRGPGRLRGTSHAKALKAIATGEFKQEIAAYTVVEKRPDLGPHDVREVSAVRDADEGPRPGTTPEGLAKLKPVFAGQRLASPRATARRCPMARAP